MVRQLWWASLMVVMVVVGKERSDGLSMPKLIVGICQ